MSEPTTTALPDLDRLADRIERAAGMIQQLRTDRDRLLRERDDPARGATPARALNSPW